MAQPGLHYLAISYVACADIGNSSSWVFLTRLDDAIRYDCSWLYDLPKRQDGPSFRVGSRITEDIEEDELGEGVELGQGTAALGPQLLGPIQHLRNPPLLR